MSDKVLPEGIKYEEPSHDGWEKKHFSQPTMHPFQVGAKVNKTFTYTKKHTVIEGVGVKFNAETLPKAKKEHTEKKALSRDDLFKSLKKDSSKFYESEFKTKYTESDIRLEKSSYIDGKLVHLGGRSFLDCCVCAFAQHLPLAISPDHIWTMITYAFAKHVDQNSEALREKFVKHEGKKRLLVVTKDEFQMSGADQPDSGEPAENWEKEIFFEFSKQIKAAIGDEIHASLVSNFSTTTASSLAASEITLMSSMKNFFSFGMLTTECGIPEFTLLGTEEDWVSLRARAEGLGALMTKTFSKYWLPLLLPVLDKFVEAYRGNVHHGFWQTMVKLRDTGGGSGSYSFISGWIQVLYPYLEEGKLNNGIRPWNEMYFTGPRPEEFPETLSRAPVDWKYHDTDFDLHFNAGFIGFCQSDDGTLTPEIGWYVTHDPEPPGMFKVEKVQQEIEDLFLGHKDEHDNGKYKEVMPWVVRIDTLVKQEKSLIAGLTSRKERAKAKARKLRRPVLRKL